MTPPALRRRARPRAIGARRAVAVAGLAAIVVLVLAARCAGSGGVRSPSGSGSADGETRLTVLAAASLTEAFTRIGKDFELSHPGDTVSFSFGSSATLAAQIIQGAPADVFAAASPATMEMVIDAGAATGTPTTFVSNTLQIAVPKGNPGHVTGLADFADAGRKIALCDPSVPCGAAAAKVFAAAGITARPDTLEQDVKATLQKVAADEVDAALVYRTDVVAAGDRVDAIPFPESAQAVNVYPIAALKATRNGTAAQAFVDYVLSPAGRAVLTRAGFDQP